MKENLSEQVEYNDFLVSRGYDVKTMDAFAKELYNLAQESNFYEDFYMEHLELYESLKSDVNENMEWADIYDFIDKVYGESSVECRTVLAPATHGTGGYSIHIKNDEEDIFYNLLRPDAHTHHKVVYDAYHITPITVHEWSHVYVNPAVIDKLLELVDEDRLDKIVELYEPVDEIMTSSGYSSLDLFIDEQIIRGITLYYYDEYMPQEDFQEELKRQEAAGFYLTEYTYNTVKKYMEKETNRNYVDLIEQLIEGYLLQ